MTTTDKLQAIKVLYRAADSLALYGIPYDMRPGQSPRDLQRARDGWTPPKPGHFGSRQIDLSDWVFLGYPGSDSGLTSDDRAAIATYLQGKEALIPGNPYEWVKL